MSNIKNQKPMVLNLDGITSRYVGNMQWPMSVKEQKQAGLIANTSRSIHGRAVKSAGDASQ